MKYFVILLILLCVVVLLCFSVFAADRTVYVNAEYSGGDGSAAAPFSTLSEALCALEDGGRIVVTSALTFADGEEIRSECEKQITVTADGGELVIEGKLYINAPIKFENIKMSFTADVPMLFCEGNDVTFGEGITTSYVGYAPIIHGGTYGGKSGMTYRDMCFSDYTITVQSGTWYYVKGGSFRDGEGQPVGTLSGVTLNITGGRFTSTKTGAGDNAVIALTGFDALRGDATMNISGGIFSCTVTGIARPGYNATTSNNQYAKGNVYINVSGGEWNGGGIRAVQDAVASEIDGDFFVKISGGSFKSFSGVNGEGVNGLAIADVKEGVAVKNVDPLITLSSGGTATVTNGGVIRIKGAVNSSRLSISGDKKVIIEGVDSSSAITVDDVLYVGTDTEIRNIRLDGGGTGIISCSDGRILIDGGITGNGIALKNFTDATVRSGLFAYLKGARGKSVRLHIDGATVSGDVVASASEGESEGYVLFTSGAVCGNIYAFEYSGKKGAVHVLADGFGGKIGAAKYPSAGCVDTFGAVAPEGAEISYEGCRAYNAYAEAVFVRDGGEGDGSSPLSPLGDLAAAVKAANGKYIVICGPICLKSTTLLPKSSVKTVITSEYMGLDYRDFCDARIELSAGLRINGETVFENVKFLAFEKDTFLSAEGHALTVGEGVECEIFEGKRVEKYPSLVGASHEKATSIESVNLTVASGTWGTLTGGSYHTSDSDTKNYVVEGDVNLNVYGGRFTDGVYLAGRANVGGDATLNVYGGIFECPVYAAHDDDTEVGGDVHISIQGGEFHGDIARYGVGKTFTLDLAGGDFDRVNTIDVGGGVLGVGDEIDLDASIVGVGQYQNPVAGYADPSVVYSDGWYYYSFSKDYLGKPALYMAKAANIYDLGNVRPKRVWSATDREGGDIVSLWAPQLYCFDGVWYLYSTCSFGVKGESGQERRVPVIWRAKTDDPFGEYDYIGVIADIDTDVYSYLSPRFIEHGGKIYMFNGGFFREEDCTNTHIQRTFVCELSDAMTMSGKAQVISTPVYDYEKGIMEGPYPFYSEDGTLFVIFAAGHTRTDEYCTGLMRFNGSESDSLLDATKWEKFSEPIHKVSYENGVYSPGAMVVTCTPSGSPLVVYHAKEYHYSAYTMRRMYVQTMRYEDGIPTVDAPAPADTVLTLELNGMPLCDRIVNCGEIGSADKKAPPHIAGETEYIVDTDVNCDGVTDLCDALLVAKAVVSGESDEATDIDRNGRAGINDIRIVLRAIFE